MLKIDPNDRPNVYDIMERICQISAARNVNLKDPIQLEGIQRTPSPPGTDRFTVASDRI